MPPVSEDLLHIPVENHGPHEHNKADQARQGHRTEVAY